MWASSTARKHHRPQGLPQSERYQSRPVGCSAEPCDAQPSHAHFGNFCGCLRSLSKAPCRPRTGASEAPPQLESVAGAQLLADPPQLPNYMFKLSRMSAKKASEQGVSEETRTPLRPLPALNEETWSQAVSYARNQTRPQNSYRKDLLPPKTLELVRNHLRSKASFRRKEQQLRWEVLIERATTRHRMGFLEFRNGGVEALAQLLGFSTRSVRRDISIWSQSQLVTLAFGRPHRSPTEALVGIQLHEFTEATMWIATALGASSVGESWGARAWQVERILNLAIQQRDLCLETIETYDQATQLIRSLEDKSHR